MKDKLKKIKEGKGITLVVLIITIILLIILAAVTISAVYKSRVIEFATNGALGYLTEQERELDYLNKTEGRLKDIEEMLKKDLGSAEGKISFSTLIWNNGKASATIHKKENNEYKIEYKILDKEGNEVQGYKEIADGGEVNNLELGYMVVARLYNETAAGTKYSGTASLTVEDLGKPIVTVVRGEVTTRRITVTVSATDNEAGMPSNLEYTYYIKKSTETNYQEDTKQTKLDASCTFENLEQNVSYDIKVEVKDIAGNTGTGELPEIITGKVPEGAGEGSQEGAIVFENLTWNNYKASVTIRKTITENYIIKYRVEDKDGNETVTEREIASGGTVGNLNLGDMVIARLTDGVNYGKTASITIGDKNPPTAPTFGTATGTAGTNGWYKSNVTVPIVAGTDGESGVLKTTYKITGAGAKGETEGTSASITAEGTSIITAYTYDKAGNKTSSVTTKEIKIDKTDPNTATTSYIAHDTNSITVRTMAQDKLSGLAKVEYQYSTDGTNYTTKDTTNYTGTTEVTTNNSYKFTGLTDGTKYWLRIKVTDMAGRVLDGTAIERTTVKANQAPSFTGTPTVAKVANSNTSLTITAKATDPDGHSLTYTLCDQNGNAITTNVTQTTNASGQVVFIHSGLGNYSTHTYIVKVTDGKAEEVASKQVTGRTYCKAEHCEGGGYKIVDNSATCSNCKGTGKVQCGGRLSTGGGVSWSGTRACDICGGDVGRWSLYDPTTCSKCR